MATDTFRAYAKVNTAGAQLRLRGPARADADIVVRLPSTQLHLRGPAAASGNINVTVPSGNTFWDTIDGANVADAFKTDATAAINNYTASLPNGFGVTWKPGVYLINDTLLLQQRQNITHIGTGVTLRQAYSGTIYDGVITGNTNFHSNSATFTSRITGADISTFGAVIPPGTTVTYAGPHDLTLSQNSTNTTVNVAYINPNLGGTLNQPFFRLNAGLNIVLRNFTMIGRNPFAGTGDPAFDGRYEAQAGVNVSGTDNVELDNLTISDIYGDFFYVSSYLAHGTNLAANVWIHDCTLARNGRQAFTLQGCNVVRINNNDVRNVRRAMFDIEPTGPNEALTSVEIDHNFFGAHRLLFMAASGGVPSTVVNGLYIHDNTSTAGFNLEFSCQPWVICATTGALPACTYTSTSNGTLTANANGVLPAQDGVTLSTAPGNNRLLVKNQSPNLQNGVYHITSMGSVSTPWSMIRTDDFDSAAELADGKFVFTVAGTVNLNFGYRVKPTTNPVVVGTTGLQWVGNAGTGPGTGPWARTRTGFRFNNNVTTVTGTVGAPSGAAQLYAYIDGVEVLNNTQPLQVRSPVMAVADTKVCTGVNVAGNDTGGVGVQLHDHP